MNELESLIVLNMVDGLGSTRIKALLEHFDKPQNIFKASLVELEKLPGIGKAISENIVRAAKENSLKKEMGLVEKHHVRIISIFDEDYPLSLKEIYDPPILLYVRGKLESNDIASLAIVGSRRASYYGQATSEKLARRLAACGITIVSGMARGIDTAAHRGALCARARTIAVLGSGIAHIYPPENKGLAENIAASGAVVSEFSMQTFPDRPNFPRRNRIISGLSLGVVVVEAARNSGALITARLALEQGREVFAVPGKVDSLTSWGTHGLIKDGAKMVTAVDDIIEEIKPILQNYIRRFNLTNPEPDKPHLSKPDSMDLSRARVIPKPRLAGDEEKIYRFLSGEPQHIDEIVAQSKSPVSEVSAILLNLEIKSLIKQLPGKMFVKRGEDRG